ncbi:MAG: hypothetical protein HY529_06640 [Chloroflexi bacterium]|nr:hypothetical protein [Chloroflexota bacterium]
MTTSWYYDYYEKDAFPHQQKLCEAVEWTKCNLDGQRLVPTTLIKLLPDGTKSQIKTMKLTGQTANPLTIRLLALREALSKLEKSINPLREIIKTQAQKQLEKGRIFGMGGTFITKSNELKTGGAPVELIRIPGKRKPIEFHHDTVHLSLYEFFTNCGSVLDRLAYEVNRLYGLPIKMIDWPKLTDTSQGKDKNWEALNSKDAKLAGFIKNCTSQFAKALGYRNRLVHDGIIRVEVNVHLFSGVNIMLAEDCNNDISPMNVDAVNFCERTKADVLKLLDGSYELMFQHLQSYGKPPW